MSLPIKAIAKLGCAIAALGLTVILFTSQSIESQVLAQLWGLNQLHYVKFKDKLKARAIPNIDQRFSFSTTESFLLAPTSSHPSGFYDHPFFVSLLSETSGAVIYYTLDGSIPTTRGFRYGRPLKVKATTVLRFRSISPGFLPSDVVNRTYFVHENIQLPVLSLIADPVVLFNPYSGIYHNALKRGRHWTRPSYIEYFSENYGSPKSFSAMVRIHGGTSRKYSPKKAFRLTYDLAEAGNVLSFPGMQSHETQTRRIIILRQGGQNRHARLRDELFQTVYTKVGGITSPFKPSVLFINGRTWGIYNIREQVNLEFLRRRFGRGQYDLIRDNDVAVAGSKKEWNRMLEFFKTHDLSSEMSFQRACQLVDVNNVTDFWIMNIYAANVDWPQWNLYSFRHKAGDDLRWKWISWDADATFDWEGQGLRHNTLAWAIRDRLRHDLEFWEGVDGEELMKTTLIVRSLLRNEGYRKIFVRRFGDLLNSYLLPERVEGALNKIISKSEHDLPLDWQRWAIREGQYWKEVEEIRAFSTQRPKIIRDYLQKEFGLGRVVKIQLVTSPNTGGTIQINSIEPDEYPWSGKYFQNEKILLRAKSSPGFAFVRWTDERLGRDSEAILELKEDISFGAEFQAI